MFQLEEQNICSDHREYAYTGLVQLKIDKILTKYEEIIKYQYFCETWLELMCKELDILAQVYRTVKYCNTINIMNLNEIKNIPIYKTETYVGTICNYIT